MRVFFRQPEKTEQNMNYQNIDKNPYPPPKSALDFRQPEKGAKKQRIARVVLGAMCVPVLLTVCIFSLFSIINSEVPIDLLFVLLIIFSVVFIIPSLVFSSIIEFFCSTLFYKIIAALIAGFIPFLTIFFLGSTFSAPIPLSQWFVSSEIATLCAVLIMHAHKKRCDIQSLNT